VQKEEVKVQRRQVEVQLCLWGVRRVVGRSDTEAGKSANRELVDESDAVAGKSGVEARRSDVVAVMNSR
jgi:hypothetical protein